MKEGCYGGGEGGGKGRKDSINDRERKKQAAMRRGADLVSSVFGDLQVERFFGTKLFVGLKPRAIQIELSNLKRTLKSKRFSDGRPVGNRERA